jgi:hypothetical protein
MQTYNLVQHRLHRCGLSLREKLLVPDGVAASDGALDGDALQRRDREPALRCKEILGHFFRIEVHAHPRVQHRLLAQWLESVGGHREVQHRGSTASWDDRDRRPRVLRRPPNARQGTPRG